MQSQQYKLDIDKIKQSVDTQNWQKIDEKLQQIPQGIYTFEPKPEMKKYYQRLLYCLSHEIQTQAAYKLTQYILSCNTNNYYALMLRTNCQNKIWSKLQNKQEWQKCFIKQLYFTSCLLNSNPKQYQIWNYKKDLVSNPQILAFGLDLQKIKNMEEQFVFHTMINDDEKNYHAWDYKSWLARYHGDLEKQIKQMQSMIFINMNDGNIKCQSLWSNCYSCWSYRFNLIMDLPADKKNEIITEQLKKVQKFLQTNSNSQCAWNYLDGFISSQSLKQEQATCIIQKFKQKCSQQYVENRFAWSFLLKNGSVQIRKEAITKLLKIDGIRKLYYQYLQKQIC